MPRYRIPVCLDIDAQDHQQAIDCAYTTLDDFFSRYELTGETPEVKNWLVVFDHDAQPLEGEHTS
jgi:hypothetical protein